MSNVKEYQPGYFEGESLDEVIQAIRSVARKRIADKSYWSVLKDTEDLADLLITTPRDFFEKRLLEITQEVFKAYLKKVSENYKQFNEEFSESYGYCEDYKILDAMVQIKNTTYFNRLCYDLMDELRFEV